jgi:hypothetical protein
MTLFVATLSVATRPLGYHPSVTTYAMIYNRYAWVLLILVLVQLFVADGRETKWKNRFDAASVGLLLGCLFFCKISYFIVGATAMGLALVLRPRLRIAVFLTAACFVLICFGVWLAFGVSAADYIRDIQAAGQAQSLAHRLRTLVRALAHNFWQVPLAAAVWYLLAKPRDWRNREAWPDTLRVTAVYLFILTAALFLTVGNAEERSDIPLFFVAGVVLLHRRARSADPSRRTRARLEAPDLRRHRRRFLREYLFEGHHVDRIFARREHIRGRQGSRPESDCRGSPSQLRHPSERAMAHRLLARNESRL